MLLFGCMVMDDGVVVFGVCEGLFIDGFGSG